MEIFCILFMCVHKARNLKYDTIEMTAATNEDYVG